MFLRASAAVTAALAIAVVIALFVYSPDAAPVQPINFSHKIHAGDYKIDCSYCHTNARKSVVAGVPSVQLCIGCHKNVAKEKPEVQKLVRYWNTKQTIPWVKVNDLPDFVYFSHKRHISANVTCQTCHGQVERMERVSAAGILHMETCVNCHLERKASIDCWTCHK